MRVLEATGVAGRPREYVSEAHLDAARRTHGVPRLTARGHLGQLRRRLRGDPVWHLSHRFSRRSFVAFLQTIAPEATTPNGVLGLKVHWLQYRWAMLRRGLDAEWWGAPVTWVLLTRDDRVRQAISLVRARQTGWWEAHARSTAREPEARFDDELIRKAMAELDDQGTAWEDHFADRGIEPLRVTYEQLTTDYEGTVRSVLRHLGADATSMPPPPIERQADELTEEWVARFESVRR